MNRFRALAIPVLVMASCALLPGCDRYRITLNEQVVSEPPGLLKGYEVADPGLDSCIEQTIIDLQIHTLEGLDSLVCTNAGIKSLDGIQAFGNLRLINLAYNQLTDLTPLLFLGELHSVNLEGNPQLDCTGVAKLQSHLSGDGRLIAPKQCAK